MRQRGVNAQRLLDVSTRFGEAIIDPAMWPNIMEEVCIVADAAGASLMWPEVALSDFPHTSALADGFRTYIAERWHERNVRAQRIVPLLKRGHTVAIDQDIVRPDEMRRLAFYTEFLMPRGFQWFAVIGVWAESDLWVLSIQRTVRQGPFETNDKLALARISQRLTETASLSRAVGGAALSGISSALCMLKQPVLALDRFGRVLDTNAAAEETFDDEFRVRDRRLSVSDQQAQSMLDILADQLRITPDNTALPMVPIIVRRSTKPPLCLHVLPIDGVARTPFLGARALLLVSDPSRKSSPQAGVLAKAFGLSRAEARLASLLANGISPERAAKELGVARETVRNQLKAILAKTGMHRQSELVALISKL